MILEVRSYTTVPGRRGDFIKFFETRAVPPQLSLGFSIFGPLLDLKNSNKFVWLRGSPSLEKRDEMNNAFYGGELWKNELEAIAMPMLESYESVLCETSPGTVFIDMKEIPGGSAAPTL